LGQLAARILNKEFKPWSVNEASTAGSEVISTLTEWLSGLYPEWRPESLQQLKDVFRVRARSAHASHAAGRLFDSVAALLGCAPLTTTYEAEAPARLESMARAALMRQARTEASLLKAQLPVLCREDATLGLLIDPEPMLDELLARARKGHDASVLALEFHKWMAESVAQMLRYGHRVTGLEDVVFSGGVFTNGLLVDLIRSRVGGDPEIGPSLHLAFHEKVPMGDGGLSLGQAWIAAKGEGECTSFR
jgi:hydrogenase maturation protein HypF